MIEFRDITKIYNSKRKHECVALNDLNFVLPDKGMVFICGKSGSGKSTLLNVLGGLDSPTSGDILVDGNPFSAFSNADYDDYRNLYVGFIFQDFCLVEGFTVAENVKLSLDLQGVADDGALEKVLKSVDLEGYGGRFPKELSGGQKQRIAIARALIKSPKLILADEPTGNLDSKTATQILTLLKELSKERLVVIVSHNAEDARTYGDRIIELSDGRIIEDLEKSDAPKRPLIQDKLITLPRNSPLSPAELVRVNEKIKEDGVTIEQAQDEFVQAKQPVPDSPRPIGKPKKTPFGTSLKMAARFSKGNRFSVVVTSIIITAVTLLLCFAQTFASFDSGNLIRQALEATDTKSFHMHKGYYEETPVNTTLRTDEAVEITQTDIDAFYDAGYAGKAYYLYTSPLLFEYKDDAKNSLETGETKSTAVNFMSPYSRNGYGVLATDEAFLTKLYGENGQLPLIAGAVDSESNNNGIVISDYAADCYLYYNPDLLTEADNPYQNLVDRGVVGKRIDISAIFETGYKERYKEVFNLYDSLAAMESKQAREEAMAGLFESDIFSDFMNEVDKYLTIGYFLGEDYGQAVLGEAAVMGTCPRFHNTDIYSGDKLLSDDLGWMFSKSEDIEQGEATIGASTYNKLFGTAFSFEHQEGFTPTPITLVGYTASADDDAQPLYTKTFIITGFNKNDASGLAFHTEDFTFLANYTLFPYAVYFDNAESAAALHDIGEGMGFYINNFYFKSVYTIKEIIEIFSDIFLYAGLALVAIELMLIVSFALRSLKKQLYEIGVLRALGGKISQVAKSFILQVILLGGLVGVLSVSAMLLLTGSVNQVLVDNLAIYTRNPAVSQISIITLQPLTFLLMIGGIFLITLLSSIVPILFVQKVKPINIIKNKE